MNNVVNAIRSENQTSAIYLQQIQKYIEMNQDYLTKVISACTENFERKFSFVIGRSKNVNPDRYELKL